MKILCLVFLPLVLGVFGSFSSFAGDFPNQINIRVEDGNREPIHHTGPEFGPGPEPNPCFPFRCGSITGPYTNPDPEAHNPENLTACIYNAAGTLLYEREGKVCPYVFIDQNQMRVEQKRLEWLKAQTQ